MGNMRLSDYLHSGEVACSVELEHDLYISTGEAVVGPAHIVITRPHIVDMTAREIIQTTHTIGQLAQPFCHTGERKRKRKRMRE